MASSLNNEQLTSLLATAIRESPVLNAAGAQEWSIKQFGIANRLVKAGDNNEEQAVLNFFKGYLSLIFYPTTEVAEIISGVKEAVCTTPELMSAVELAESILSDLSQYDIREGQAVYNMNIFAQFFELESEVEEDTVDICSLQGTLAKTIRSLDLPSMTSEEKVELETEDMGIVSPFLEAFSKLAEEAGEDQVISVISSCSLGEMRKGCMLIVMGPAYQVLSAPFFVNARTCIGKIPTSLGGEGIMFVYQKVLPLEVLERIIRISYTRNNPSGADKEQGDEAGSDEEEENEEEEEE
ncbi:hypothetical protein DL96DRAFT_1822522 [Flagelloscypha sp. PMI_526]|nr:hypothetical protein DL96DRAFT_1822522 [Flagelloscypha sp. PMI_526]